tara:strand:+ start:4917 stop:5447 length:531 start_codon:yes stop_codon:yes gene_type:complete
MRTFLEFASLIIFFVLYKIYDIQVATAGLIIASLIQFAIAKFVYKDAGKKELITTALIVVFGGMTLLFNNPEFLKWKVTILKFLFGGILIVAHLMDKNLLKLSMGKEIQAPDAVWAKLSHAWAAFFIFSGILNIYVSQNFSLDTWVEFKTFWLFGLSLIALVATILYLSKYIKKVQ